MDENAVAPVSAGEATPSTNNIEAPSPSTPENGTPVPAPVPAPQVFSPEEAQAIKSFLDSNGGFEKVKKNLTARQADIQAQTQTLQANPTANPGAQNQPTMTQPVQPEQPRFTGGMSAEEFMVAQYFDGLCNTKEYSHMSEQIRSGEVLKQMVEFNIAPLIDGRLNTDGIHKFMDLYAKTIPAQPAQTPVTATPTVEYVQVGETITNMNDATRVLAQDQQLRAQGLTGHPLAKQANEFFDNVLNANQNRGRVEHTTLAEAKKK